MRLVPLWIIPCAVLCHCVFKPLSKVVVSFAWWRSKTGNVAVTQTDFTKSMLRIEERLAGAEHIANATLQSFRKEMANYVDGVVDQAKAAFTTLEAHARQDLTQGVISSAKDEIQNMKNIIDGTILKIEASLAAVVVRIDALDEQVKKFWDHGWDHDGLVCAIKALSGRVDQVEGRVVNGGVSPNSGSVPTRGYLPEKSMLPKVFEGNLGGEMT